MKAVSGKRRATSTFLAHSGSETRETAPPGTPSRHAGNSESSPDSGPGSGGVGREAIGYRGHTRRESGIPAGQRASGMMCTRLPAGAPRPASSAGSLPEPEPRSVRARGRFSRMFPVLALLFGALCVLAAAPAQAQSTDATLKGLTAGSASSETGTYFLLNIGTFAATTTTYTATVPFARTHVKLTPKVNESNATVGVRKGSTGTFASVDSGSRSAAIALDVGSSAITVRVTAQDTTTTKDYTVTITRQSAPAPSGFMALPGNAALIAKWQPVAGANSYKIEWDAAGATGFSNTATATPGTARRETITIRHSSADPVVNGSAYKLRVSACSGADGSTGCGTATAAQTVTPGTPGRIHSFSIGPGWVTNGRNTLEVTWYPVAANGSPVIGYDVHYTTTWYVGGDAEAANTYIYDTMYERMPDPSEGWVRIVRYGPGGEQPHTTTARRQTLVNVELGVHYRVRIRAVNAVGPGPWRHTGYGIPESVRAPNVPRNVRLEPGDAKLTLRWEAPGTWGSWPAGGYEVLWKLTSAVGNCPVVGDSRETAACAAHWKPVWKNGSKAVIGPGETSFEFTGAQHGSETVTNGTSYDLRIRGWNKRPGTDGSTDKNRRATPFWYPAKISGTPANSPILPNSPAIDRQASGLPLLETCAAHLPSNAVSVSEVTGWRDAHSHDAAHVLRWNQVLEALGEDTGTDASSMTVEESKANEGRWTRSRWSRVTTTLDAVDKCAAAIITAAPDLSETASGPMVLLTGPTDPVAEGSPARITVTLSEALAADVTVPLTVTRDSSEPEDHGTLAGITVPAGFTSASAEIATNQDDDTADERFIVALGALPAGLQPGSRTSVAVTIADDDTEQAQGVGYTVPAELVRTVRHYYEINRNKPSRGENWFRVLIAFGAETHATLRPFTVAEAEVEVTKWSGWQPILDALRKLEAAQEPAAPPATPEVSIAAGPGVTEGSDATFTVTADPAPAAPLAVAVTVTESGGFASAGSRQVTVPASGTATFTVATVGDAVDEPDGSVTAALAAGTGYTVSSSQGTATVAVADDDPAPATPEVSISAGAGVTEGNSATFTLTASPAPSAPLTVAVTVTESGSYASPGTRQVTVPASGTATFTVATVGDAVDEPDGSVTAALAAGTGYTVSSSKGVATVAVADDDEPLPEVSIAAGPAVTEGGSATFTLTAAPAPAADLAVAVAVSQSGAVAQPSALGARTVTIAAGTASAAFTVATVDDTADEPDGTVRAALAAGAGYTVGTASGAAVAVADNDEVALPAFVPKRGIAREGTHDAVVFTVRLSHASTQTVAVDWTTADAAGPWARRVLPATAGADYVAASGTLTFAAGETRKTVSVALLDDAIDEGMEYFLLRFSNLRGATVGARDLEVEGIIRNDDHLQAMWLSRFGRAVGGQVTDAVSGRLEADLAPGAHATLAGQALDLSQAGDGKALADAMTGLAQAFGAPGAPAADEDDPFARHGLGGAWNAPATATAAARPVTGRELLLGSSFHLSSGGDGSGPGLAAWGRVAQTGLDGEHADDEGRTRVDGEVLTGVLGADADFGGLLAGVAVSLSEGEGTFNAPHADTGSSGSIESAMTVVSPYARVKITERVSAWGLAGWGTGDMTIGFDDGAMAPVKTDLGMQLGAIGARGALLEQDDAGGLDLAVKADAFFVRTESDAAANSAKTEADASRLRLVLEGGRAFDMGNGATFRPSLELGVRHDGGDAETGAGVEVGGGVSYADAATGLSIEAKGRMLVAHADSDYEEWGMSATARLDPGADGRGLSLSLSPAIGTSGSATERLWGAQDARGLAPDGAEFEAARGLTAEAGYGMALFGDRFTGTPNVGFGMADGGARDWRIGWRLTSAIEGDPGFEVSLDATRREPANDNGPPEHGIMLRSLIRW